MEVYLKYLGRGDVMWRWKMYKIRSLYKQWAESIIGEEVTIEWAPDFYCLAYYPYKIWVGMLMTEQNINELPKFLKENFDCNFSFSKFQIFTLCFLHEVGHIMTDWQFDDLDKDYCRDTITTEEYRKLPHEWAADEWAVEHINKNGREVHAWQKKLEKAYAAVTQKDLEKWTKSKGR
jgi:hypothetical protein